jgi:hypothetical protein
MQRQGQIHLRKRVGERAHAASQAGGRYGEPPRADAEGLRIGQLREAGEERPLILQRFAHAHVDNVAQRRVGDRVFRHVLAPEQHLVRDLFTGQIAGQPEAARGAERARERATGLRTDAARPEPRLGVEQDGFDAMAIGQFQQRLVRPAVCGYGDVCRRHGEHPEAIRQLPAQVTAQR